jgi:hypothetical protein
VWCWWVLSVAVGGELVVELRPDPPPRAAERVPPPHRPLVPFARGEVLADGVLDEEVWAAAPSAPALSPWMLGLAPPMSTLRVAVGERGLGFAWTALPPQQTVELLVDPDGLQQRWWRVELREEVRLSVCDEAALPPTALPAALSSHAVPCVAVADEVGRRTGAVAEVLLPWSLLGESSSELRLLWRQGQGRHGGTWSPNGRGEARPEHGLRLDLPRVDGRLRLEERFVGALSREVVLERREGEAPSPWRWRRVWQGREVASGVLRVGYRAARLTLEGEVFPDEGLELGPVGEGPLRPVVVGRLRPGELRVWSVDPLPVEAAVLRWSSPIALARLELRVVSGQEVLGVAELELPAGTGELTVRWPDELPDAVRVQVPALGLDVPVLRQPR